MAARFCKYFFLLSAFRAQELTFGALELLMTVKELFTELTGNTLFLKWMATILAFQREVVEILCSIDKRQDRR